MSSRPRIRAAVCALAAVPAVLVAAGTAQARQHNVCSAAPPGYASCLSIVVQQQRSKAAAPGGLNPADLQNAYELPSSTAGAARTVAIVDAFDDPSAEADMNHYRAQFGIPACTTSGGCFRKVNQSGGSMPPAADTGWAEEISLDLDMVSATCPNCHILLVETTNNSFANLAAGVDRAAALGANAISNSYGGSEYSTETSDQSHYNHPGIAVTVSSGDNGFGVEFPAASQYVTAVGGTTLRRATGTRGWSETVWSGAGSGCSRYVTKPSWQTDSGCARRTVADVSSVANPNTGVSVYDTYGGVGGWLVFGGTSAAAPLIASVYALAGNSVNAGSYPYAHTSSLFDVTSGNNGRCSASASYLCTAKAGYDGPTGLGTPNGTGAF